MKIIIIIIIIRYYCHGTVLKLLLEKNLWLHTESADAPIHVTSMVLLLFVYLLII
jgi:hypothetical protein